MSLKHEDIHYNGRFAGEVVRYHIWPTTRPQTIASHTWQVMRIWYQIFGPLPPEISTYLLWHDAGEIYTGDLPFMFKREHPEIKDILTPAEDRAINRMGGSLPELDADLKLKTKLCDLIEMLEFGIVELAFGNSLALPIVNVTLSVILDMKNSLATGDDLTNVDAYLFDVVTTASKFGVFLDTSNWSTPLRVMAKAMPQTRVSVALHTVSPRAG